MNKNTCIGISFSFFLISGIANATATLQSKNESVMDHAVEEASNIKKGDREVSELLARLIQKDADLIFNVKKLDLSNSELLSLYTNDCGADLEKFSQKIKELSEKPKNR